MGEPKVATRPLVSAPRPSVVAPTRPIGLPAPTALPPATDRLDVTRMQGYASTIDLPRPEEKTASSPVRDGVAQVGNAESWFAGVQTFVQGAVRGGVQILKGAKFGAAARMFGPVADFFEGGNTTLSAGQKVANFFTETGRKGVELLAKGGAAVSKAIGADKAVRLIEDVGTSLAPKAAAAGNAAGKALGGTAKFVGKVAPVLNVASSSWETYKAFAENDPAKKPAAVANATISWASTGLALGAVAVGATPVGWGLAAGAAAVAGFQLVDSLAFDGKATKWIGDTGAKAWEGTKNVAAATWEGTKNVAAATWNGTKNVAAATWNGTKNVAAATWNGTKNVASGAWNGAKSLASKLKFW